MSDESAEARRAAESRRAAEARRRRREEVFGEVLPDSTADERDPDPSDAAPPGPASEEWLKANVPPHHT